MIHKIDSSFNTRSVTVNKGDVVEIRLNEKPTSGYRWEAVVDSGPHVYDYQDDDFEVNKDSAIGGGGVRTLRFRVNNNGADSIKLRNRQPWSKDVYETFELKLNKK